MKANGKPSKPIIAAKSKKNNGHKPAPPDGKSTGKQARVSRVPRAVDEMKTLVLDRISDGLLGFDADMNSTYVNQRAGEILGCEPESLLGKNFQEAYPDSTGTPFADAFQRALETQTVVPFESYFPESEGWFQGRVYPTDDGVSVLLTDRKEKQVVDISKLPEQNPYPVMCLRRDGSVLYANRVATQLLESWRKEGQGMPSQIEELLPVVLDTHVNQEVEFQNEDRIYIGLLVPIQETGQVNIYCRDITERRQSYESLQVLINQGTTGITRSDLEGRFTFVNQAFCDMLGYSESELLGKTIWEVSHPDDIAKNQRLHERLRRGEPYQLEKRLVRRNGAILWITVGASPLQDAAGNIWAASSIVVDITRRKRAEESLLDSARRTLYLGTLSDTIRSLSGSSQMQTESVHILGAYLKASRVAYLEIGDNGDLISRAHYVDGVTDVVRMANIHQYLPEDMLAKLGAGRAVIVTDVKTAPGYGEEFQASYEANAIRSQVMLPVLRHEQLVAALCVQQSSAREWRSEEVHLMEETLERMRAAVERVRSEIDLRESEERLRLATQAAHLCTWELDIPSQTYKLGNNFEDVVGFSRAYLPEKSSEVTDRINVPEDLQAVRETLMEAVKTRSDEVSSLQYRLIHPETEEVIWVEVNAKLVYDNEGKPQRMYGMLQNITGRKRKEEELRAQEAELQAIINRTPFMLTRCDRDLRYRFVSRAYAEMIGRAPEEVAGKSIVEIMGEEGFRTILPHVEQVLKGKRVEYETEVSFAGVGAPALHVIYTPDYDEQGNVIGWFASITDVTGRKAAEEELRQTERRFRQAANASGALVYEVDLSSGDTAVIHGMESLAGYDAQEITASSDWWHSLIHPEDLPEHLAQLEVLLEQGGTDMCEYRLRHRLGNWITVQDNRLVIPNEAGQNVRLVGTMIDITERKAEEEERKQLLEQEQEQRARAEQAKLEVEHAKAQADQELSERKLAEAALGAWTDNPLSQEARPAWLRYGMAIAATTIAVLVRTLLHPVVGDFVQYATLFGAIAFSVWYGGIGPALVSAFLGYVGISWLILDWRHFLDPTAGSWIGLSIFLFSSAIVMSLGNAMRRAQRHAHQSARVAVERQRQAEFRLAEQKRAEEALLASEAKLMVELEDSKQLQSISSQLIQEDNIQVLYEQIVEAATALMRSDMGSMQMLYPDRNELHLLVSKGFDPTALEFWEWVRVDSSTTCSLALHTGERVVIPDVETSEFMRGSKDLDFSRLSGIRAVQSTPLVSRDGHIVGMISTHWRQVHQPSERELQMLDVLARQAADLIERRRAEEALRESERKFSLIYDNLPFAAALATFQDSVIVDVNEEFERAFGYSKEEVIGKTAVELGIKPDADGRQESARNLEIELVSRSGEKNIYLTNTDPVSINAEKYFLTTLQNITERRQMEQALARERELFRLLFETMPVMVSMYDPETQSMRLNAEFERSLGWRSEDVTVPGLVEALYPDPEYRNQVLQRMAVADKNEWVEVQVQTRDGRRLDSLWSNISIMNDKEIVTGIALGIDITERKHAEEALRRNEEMFSTLVNAAPFGVYFIDSEFRLRSINKGAESVFSGIDPLLGRDFAEILHIIWKEPFATEAIERFQHTLRTGESFVSPTIVEERANINEIQAYDWQIHRITLPDGTFGVVCYFYDLSDQKRMEATVRASEKLYRAIARSIPGGGVYVVDKDFRYLVADGPVTEAFGLSREMLEGHTVSEVFPDERGQQMEERIRQNFAGEIVNFETQHNGRVYWTQQAPLHDSIGQAIIVTMDITERKQAEERLRASEEKYRRIVETANEGIWEIDQDTRTMFVNPRMAEMLGYTVEEMIGRPVFDFLLPEDYTEGERRLESAKQGDSTRASEFRYRRKDNSILWTVASNTAERDEQGNFLGAFAMMSDITERKKAEQALQQSEERFARFMQYLPGLAWIKDVQGRYIYANAAAEQAFSTPRDQLYGRTDREIFQPEEAEQFRRNDEQVLQEAKAMQVVEQLQQDDGILHYSLVTKFPIPGADGNIAWIGGTAFDITERVQMEEAIKQAREQAEETADRMARLQQITAALTQTLTPAQLAELALEQGTRAAGAATGVLAEKLNDSPEVKIVAALGYPDGVVRTNPMPLSEPSPLADCIRTGQASWLGSQEEFALYYPQQAEGRSKLGLEALVVLPLIVGNQTLGSLAFSFAEPHEFLAEERGFFLSLAHQCAQALERAHAAEALRESEERYRAIIKQATAGIVRKDPEGRLIFVNEAFCNMVGFAQSELLGKTMWELTHEEDVRENKRLFNLLMRDGIQFELEKRLICRDGSILWATVGVSPVMDAGGKPQSAVSVYTDITDRKQAEQDLQESRERYRDLFHLVPIAVYTCDPSGLIQEYNRSAVDLWGREPTRNDPSERYCGSFKLYFPDGRFMPHRKCPMARMLAGETLQPEELEIIVERRDGSRRNVIAHPLAIRNERGEIIGAINCLYDMTPRKQAEERFALLAEVSELTRKIEEPDELMAAVANLVGRHLQVGRCLFNEIDLENDTEIVHRDYHNGVPSVQGVHKISDYSAVTSAEIAAGKTIVNHDSMSDPRTAADYERSYQPNGERAYIAVPLMRNERWVASLWVSDDTPRQWDPEEVALIESVAERTWAATEKLRINSALRDSEERLRVTFNTTAVGFATLAPDTRFIDVNEAFCEIVGYSRQELLNMDCNALTHPDYLEDTRGHVAKLIAGEIPSFVLEKLYVRKNGAEIWVQNSVSVVRDTDGVAVHLIAIIQDITERRRTEEALQRLNLELESRVEMRTAELQAANEELRESEATSRVILESMPDAIVITDREGRIVHCNAQVETLFGYQPDEALGQFVEILMPHRFHESHVEYRRIFNDDRYPRLMGLGRELFGLRKDQSEFPIEMLLSPISNNTNWDVMITIRDNTQQRKAQEAIRTNEEKLRTLFELLPVGISFLDNEGRITEMNPALTQILGLSKGELLRGKYKERRYVQSDGSPMPPENLASVRAHVEQKSIYDVETGIVKDNGETIWTSVNAAPVDVADVDVVIATIDITARKKAEEALRRNRERLRVLSRRLVEVQEEERRAIARELHDRVGQNLAALNLNLNILRSQLSQDTIERVGGRINDSVGLVNQILTITRSVMSDLRSNVLDDYGLESAIREYADQFTQRTGVRVVIEKPANPVPRLHSGIEMTLLRIAQEALTNIARHAQATQATITIRADHQAVYMSVQDDGIGILSWQKANQPGSHGLRIIRERAEAFDGSLQVNSAYKKGTTIEVRIPLGRNNE